MPDEQPITPDAAPDWQNDPEFHQLPLPEKHKALLQIDPDYAHLPAQEQSKALNVIHYGPNGTQFEQDRDPATHESGTSHVLSTLGRQIRGAAEASVKPWTGAAQTYKKARAGGAGFLSAAGQGAGRALYEASPVSSMLETGVAALNTPKDYHEHRQAGYSPAYSAAAPLAASATGVNLPKMEHFADIGDTKGVLAEAAVPAAEVAGGEAVNRFMAPEGLGGTLLENRRQTKGPQNILRGLDTPGGKGGERAVQMKADVDIAKGDLAELQKGDKGFGTDPETTMRGKDAEAHWKLAQDIDARQEKLWKESHDPGIKRHADAPIDQNAIINAAKSVVNKTSEIANDTGAAKVNKWVKEQLSKPLNLKEADDLIRELNKDLEKSSPETYAPLEVRARQEVVKELRNQVDQTLTASGEQPVKGVNRRWGALGNIKDRLQERAAQLARTESKESPVPDWVKTYAFLHPESGIVAGVGVKATGLLKKTPGGALKKGMKQLGKTNLEAPIGDQPPPGWGAPPAGLLGQGEPPATPTGYPDTDPSGTMHDPTARWARPRALLSDPGQELTTGQAFDQLSGGKMGGSEPPVPPAGIDPRYARLYPEDMRASITGQQPPVTGTPEDINQVQDFNKNRAKRRADTLHSVADDAQAAFDEPRESNGPPPALPASELPDRRGMARPGASEPERRTDTSQRVALAGSPIESRLNQLRAQLKDPSLSDRDRSIMQAQLDDAVQHPFDVSEKDVSQKVQNLKAEKKMTRAEAEAETEKRKEGRNARADKPDNTAEKQKFLKNWSKDRNKLANHDFGDESMIGRGMAKGRQVELEKLHNQYKQGIEKGHFKDSQKSLDFIQHEVSKAEVAVHDGKWGNAIDHQETALMSMHQIIDNELHSNSPKLTDEPKPTIKPEKLEDYKLDSNHPLLKEPKSAGKSKWSLTKRNTENLHKNGFEYAIIDDIGNDTGAKLQGTIKGDTAEVDFIGHDEDEGFTPGSRALRDVMDHFKKSHPGVKQIKWLRTSGARQDNSGIITTPLKARMNINDLIKAFETKKEDAN